MKNIFNVAAAFAVLILASCSKDDDRNVTGTGNIGIEFDNAFTTNDLILDTQTNVTSQNENLKISAVKYIISNIRLTKDDGSVYTYPKSESYFIVDESDETTHVLQLHDIPAGDYTKVTFGIGVDEQQFNLGADGQGDFLAWAQSEGMLLSWSAGYKFLMLEGTFTSPTVSSETPFMIHTGQTATDYNYTEVTLDLPTDALVRTTITPDVHIIADVSKIIDGSNKIILSDNNLNGTGAMIMGGENLALITQNLPGMFSVAHVHND